MSPAPRKPDDNEEWVDHGGPLSFKWADRNPGDEFVGLWLGTAPGGTYGERQLIRGRIDAGTEVYTFDVPTALQGDVADLPVGLRVKLIYLGMDKSAKGRSFHKFKIRKSKGAPRPPASAPTDAPPPRGDHEAPPNPNDEEDNY
jgi:hypothetical protein